MGGLETLGEFYWNRAGIVILAGIVGFAMVGTGILPAVVSTNQALPLAPFGNFVLPASCMVVARFGAACSTMFGFALARQASGGFVLALGAVLGKAGAPGARSIASYYILGLACFLEFSVIGFTYPPELFLRLLRGGRPVRNQLEPTSTGYHHAAIPSGASRWPFVGETIMAGHRFCRLSGTPGQ